MSFMENFEKELNGMRASEGKSAVKVSNGSKSSSKSTTKKKKKKGFMDNFYDELSSIADDDIGPVYDRARNRMTVKSDDEEDDSKLDFFQKGLFEDGYQAGDITKTILGTAGDAALGVVKGVGSLVEGVVDLGQYGVAGVADLLGKEEAAKDWKESAKWNLVDSVTKDASDYLDKYSVLGRTSEAILQGVGQVGGIVATGGLGAAAGLGTAGTTALTTGVMGLSSMGSGMGEAYQGGATDEEAVTYGLISGAADALTEMMFGGMGKAVNAVGLSKGLSSADDMLAKAVSKKFSNQIAKNFAEFGVKASAEGLEEVVAGVAQAMGKKFTYMSEKDMKDILEDENLLEQFIVGSATSGMIQSGIIPGTKKGSLIEANKNESDFLTGTTKNEQAVIRKEVENRVAAEEQSGKKLTEKEKDAIEEQVVRDLEKGYISTDTIEEVLGGSTYDIYKGTVDSEDAILREYEELGQKTNATLKDQARYTELTQKVKDIREKSQRDALKTQLGEEVFNLVKGDRLIESYNERARRGQAFQADLTKYDAKQQAVIQKAIDSGILNNTHRTHDFVDMVAKISADKGVLFDFTNNQKLKDSGFAVEGKQVNGYVTKDGITLNIDSKKAMETTVGHEITHVLEGTEFYDSLKQTIFEYAKAKGEYQTRFDSLTELYKDVKDADIEGELAADLVGEYLFSDTDFINNLSTQNRNVFQKIYDEIKYLCKIATAGSKEARELERVRKAFEDAYRAGGKAQGETKYSMSDSIEEYSDMVDSDGEVLTVAQKNYFEKNGLKDDNGNLIKLYRSADGGRTVWDGRGAGSKAQGIYLTDDVYVARAFASDGRKVGDVLEVYANAQNPLIIDAEGSNYMDIPMPADAPEWLEDSGDWEGRLNADQLPVDAFANGHDAVIIKNVREGVGGGPATDVILRDSNQMKRTDNKNPSADPDIRYSLSDSDGRQLTAEQQEYFKDSKVRDENGNLKVMYHGTSKGGFTVFDTYKSKYGLFGTGFYFTDSENIGNSYTKKGKGNNPKVYEAYLNIKNPLDMDAVADPAQWAEAFDDVDFPESGTNEDFYRALEEYYADEQIAKWEVEDIIRESIEYGMGYDGITHIGGGRVNADGERHQVYIAFEPEQIKNIDNTKPTDSPDIRFSLSESVEETKDLMALHNLHTNEVLKQLDMGGLPYPSVAITKPGMISHDEFGEVTLILNKDAIDPKKSKYNKVYSADAYTPTFPQIYYEASEQVAENISSKVNSYYSQLPYHYQQSIRSLRDFDNIDDTLNRQGGEQGVIEKYADNYGMKQLYLAEKGEVVPVETKRTETRMTDTQMNLYQSVVESIGVDVLRSFNEKGSFDKLGLARMAWLEQHGEALKDVYAENWSSDGTLTKAEALEIASEQTKLYWKDEINRALKFAENGGVTVTETDDISGTNAKIDEKIADSDYKQWLSNLFSGIEGRSGLRNSKDTFTPSGNRRTFAQLHDPVTVDNIVKIMRKENQKGQGAFGGGNIQGASAKEYGSISEIKRNADKLGKMDKAEHDAISDRINDTFFDIARRYASGKDIIDAQTAIAEAVAKSETKAGIARYLKQYDYVYKYTDEIGDEIIALRDYIRSLPTPYFEAKPQRAVGFDEVAAFVIPYDSDVKLKQELLNRGYFVAEYDPKVEGDRQRVVNQFEEYKFSLSNVGEEPVRPNYRVTMGEDIALQTEDIAPVGVITSPTAEENSTVQQETQLTEDNSTLSETETVAPLPDSGEEVKQTRKQYHQSIIDRIRGTFKARGFDFDEVLKKAKNLSTWSTVDNTPQRVMEKSLGYKEGGILADITVNQVAQNETEGIKWVNENVKLLKEISKQYHIKPGSKKSAAAQMYAEGFYVDKDNNIVQYGDRELAIDFPDPKVRANIKGLARDPRIRKIYDDTLASINESRTRNLYPEIPRLDNYFLHFRAMNDTFSTLGLPFNPNDIKAKDLPTDLNGVTADLKPGQPYFASAMHREGKRTSFDMLGGIERYLNSAKNQIYHIDDIQTLRALRNYIAETYGQATGLEDIDSMSDAEAEERIKQVYGAHLSTFAKFLNEEANVLAGKTALIDRGFEGIIGRRGITFLNTLNQQVGSNMVGYNISSSLTNFLPVAQTFAKTNKFDFVKAFAQTAANKVSGGRLDSFSKDSPVVIRRKGQDRFYQTPWQKMQNPGYALMGMVDDISTELIARTKYNELTRKGMDSQKAHFETDKWVSRLMGDRSLGQMPQLYNSKMLGLITKFQLEVRNQLDAQFYDTVQETKVSNEHIRNGLARNARTAAQVASTFAQLAVVQHLFGMAFESVAGYNPAFDIIEVLMTAFGYDDEEDSEDTALDNFAQGLLALAEDMPYASTFTGGRIPISEAIPDVNAILRGEDEYGNEIGIPQAIVENAKEIAPYYLMPAGFGQIKKTKAGLDMFSDEHPIAGSYTDAGNLRFSVEDTMKNRIHAGIFGQYANENARKYFDQEQRTLNPDQTEILAGLDIPIEEYWEYRDNLYEFYDVKDQMKEAAYADGATSEDSLKYKYINSVYNEIYDLYDKQKELASGNSSNKQSKLRSIQNQMEQMLSESKSAMDNAFITSSYAEVGDRRYNYDADKDTWYEIKPKNADGTDNWYYQKEQEVTKGLGISYTEYWSNREEYNYAYDKPGRYAISQAVGGYDAYMEYYDALENWQSDNYIASDKDEYGNTISGSRKPKVWDYIDGLDLDYGEKLILYRTVYSSKKDKNAYNMEIVNYLNSRSDLSYGEKKSILEELEMTVDDEGYIDW